MPSFTSRRIANLGTAENDGARMVHTPWSENPVPFEEAAETGTRKVITEHATIGMLVTSDGTIGDIPRDNYIGELIELARRGGYKGIDLGYRETMRGEAYEEFLVELRGRMIGSDLILISEILPGCDGAISDYSDGAILSFDKCADMKKCDMPFDQWEGSVIRDFADNSESTKTFIELPVFANSASGDFIEVTDATDLARRSGAVTNYDKNSLISSFENKKHGSIVYNSLSSINARMDMLA